MLRRCIASMSCEDVEGVLRGRVYLVCSVAVERKRIEASTAPGAPLLVVTWSHATTNYHDDRVD